jgi:hypothetical protein
MWSGVGSPTRQCRILEFVRDRHPCCFGFTVVQGSLDLHIDSFLLFFYLFCQISLVPFRDGFSYYSRRCDRES